jgi:hypothetical protein
MGTDTIAYIAGLFDGEGCVTCKKVKTKRKNRPKEFYNQWYIRCEISMTDKHIIQWIHETLGFGWSKEKKYTKKPTHYKRQWRWCCGYRDALIFAKMIWPYVQVKVHAIENIIDHYDALKPDRKNIVDLNLYKQTKRERCPHN